MKKYYNPELEIVMLSENEDVLTMSVQVNAYSGFGNVNDEEGVWNW